MKKILFIILIFFCYIKDVNGETYYGEYRKVDEIGNYCNDTLLVDTTKLYNTYKSNYVDMGYITENYEFIIDKNDYKDEYIEISKEDIGDEYINISTNVSIESDFVITGLTDNMKIYEIEIFINDEKVNLGVLTAQYKYVRKVIDNNLDTYLSGEELDRIFLFTNSTNEIEDFKINIYTNDVEDYELEIMLDMTKIPIVLKTDNKNKHIISFTYQNKPGYDILYKYKGIKKLYRHYKEEKEILNKYVDHGDNLLFDDYIEISDYYVRDKLILKDNIIINDEKQKIEEFIEYSSGDVNIDCNIDYNINQKYTCVFLLGDILVTKDIIVDIPNNIKVSEDNIIENTNKNSDYYYISNLKEEKNKPNEEIIITTQKQITTKKLIIKKEKNKVNKELINIVKYIIITNLIIIEILLFIKKKKK